MTDIPEPTEEQKQAARDFLAAMPNFFSVEHIARLLAEREHKLRNHCVAIGVEVGKDERDALRADLDAARAEVATWKDDSQLAWTAVGRICKALWVEVLERPESEGVNRDHEEIVDEVIHQRDAARARIAELEAKLEQK